MRKFHCTAATAIVFAFAHGAFAASPAQVGTYVGTFKTKLRTISGVTSAKNTMQVDIAPDNTTTVTVDNVVHTVILAFYGTSEGIFTFADPGVVSPVVEATLVSARFRNNALTGVTTSLTYDNSLPADGLIKTSSGKFKLKKQQ
jgi:hypothetical protein